MTGPHVRTTLRLTTKRLALLRKVDAKDEQFRRRVTDPEWISQYAWARDNGLVKFDASGSLVLTLAGTTVLASLTPRKPTNEA